MKCPFCQSDTKVSDTRTVNDGSAIRRRRQCLVCSRRFSTFERYEAREIRVVKRDGRREPFNLDKIRRGVDTACGKRPISEDQKDDLVHRVEHAVRSDFEREVSSVQVGKLVMDGLRSLDEVAFVRFASVYKEYSEAKMFAEELRQLRKVKPPEA